MNWLGLAAQSWDLSMAASPPAGDEDFFRREVERGGGPALDVGCGTGRLLLPFLEAGLDVEGLEPSPDMLALCRAKAEARGLKPTLHQQSMERMELPRRYRTIFIPCGSLQLVMSREECFEALRRLREHLAPGGTLVLTIYNRWRDIGREKVGEWILDMDVVRPSDGATLRMWYLGEPADEVEQVRVERRRYEVVRDGAVVQQEHYTTGERWFFRHELELMLERAGFRDLRIRGDYTDQPFAFHHKLMVATAAR